MKLNKIFNYFGIVGISLAVIGCTDDEPKYSPAPGVELPTAYFSLEDGDDIVFDEASVTYEVPVYRADGKGEVSVPLTYTVTPETGALTVPASVSFADGATETFVTVTVDPDKITANKDYELSLILGDGANSPYALQTVTYPMIYESWVVMTGIDKDGNEVDKALYCDDLVASLYGLDPVEYEVTIQHHPDNENLIRVVDPYGAEWPYSMYGDYDSSKHHYMYFNLSNPEMVYLCDKNGTPLGYRGSDMFFYTGLTLDNVDGEIYLTSFFNYYLSRNNSSYVNYAGKLSQGNITFGAKEMLASFPEDTGLYYANSNGKFRIILPGYDEYVDPSTVWTEIGTGVFTDGILYPIALMEEGSDEELPSYNVAVAQFGGDPNLYRIMNPWKAGVCPYGIDYTGDRYIEIDVTEPDCVVMDLQSTGISFGSGALYIINYGTYMLGNGASVSDVVEMGVNDTFKNGIVYSAPGNLLFGFPGADGGISLSRGKHEWQLVMPNAVPAAQTNAAYTGKSFNGDAPLRINTRFVDSKSTWAVTAPVFSYATKTLKR